MSVKIDDLELISRVDDSSTGAMKELLSVPRLNVSDRRSVVELKVPGADGSILQEMGRSPLQVRFSGKLQGEDAKTRLDSLRSKFEAGKPLPFSTDLTDIAEVTKIIIEDLHIFALAGQTDSYGYDLTIREYKEAKEPEEETPPSQDEEAEDAVEDETDDAAASVNYVTGKVLDEEGNPRPDVKVVITDAEGNEYEATTDEDGVYRKDDLPTGKYTVAVKEEGYEEAKKEVEISGSSGQESETAEGGT